MGDVVSVPVEYGLGPIEVTAIGDGAVEMAASLTGRASVSPAARVAAARRRWAAAVSA